MSDSVSFAFFKFLAADTILAGLLGATNLDSKIYPLIEPDTDNNGQTNNPYIVYEFLPGNEEEITKHGRMIFKIVVSDYNIEQVETIANRLIALLDVQSLTLPIQAYSTDFYIDWCRGAGGSSSPDKETREIVRVWNLDINYREQNSIGG